MNKLVLYREVEELSNKGFIVMHDEYKYKMVLEPIEITEEEMVKILRGIRIGGDLMLFNYEAEYLAKKILSKLTGDGDRT
jgi:hypothetical protein